MSQQKHPLCIRWNHWLNFPILLVMIWSGILIYWAYPIYFIPGSFLKSIGLGQRLAEGIAWHFVFAWLFTINGLIYVLYLLLSKQYRYLLPSKSDIKALPAVVLHDLGLRKEAPPVLKYNAAQKIAYSSVLLMGVGSLLTGIAIYKPVQFSFLVKVLGGYQAARVEHFALTVAFLVFFFVHVLQVLRAGWLNFSSMVTGDEIVSRGRFRLSFLFCIGGLLVVSAALRYIYVADRDNKISWVLRKGLNLQGSFWAAVFRENALAPSVEPAKRLRVNGKIGILSDVDIQKWRLELRNAGDSQSKFLSYEELRSLPATTTSFEFKCIEGWSQMLECRGVRFSDLMNYVGKGWNGQSPYRFAGLKTIDAKYFVSLDRAIVEHPQSVLCYEIQGQPLSIDHGFPLRLATPAAYGVKQIKQIGSIEFSDEPPPDYWARRGYDTYLGL